MTETENELLLEFFKALADASRLKIVGMLATGPCTVERLAQMLDLSPSTISHHLYRLGKVGLVSAKAQGYYSVFSLHTDVLGEMAGKILKTENLPNLAPANDQDAWEQKILSIFMDGSRRIKAFPAQEKKYLVLLKHIAKEIDSQKKYTEQEISDFLEVYSDDYSKLRRDLVEYGFLKREGGGGKYWKENHSVDQK